MAVSNLACNCAALRKASRRLTQLYDDALAPSGLRSTQFTILNDLHWRGADAPTIGELAEALVMDRSSVGHTLRPLARDGYVTLVPSKADRRQQLVRLTRKGEAKWSEGHACWRNAQDEFETLVGKSGAAELRKTHLELAQTLTRAVAE